MAMKQSEIDEILQLPAEERIQLAELIWNSIASTPDALSVSDEVKEELAARLREMNDSPDDSVSWEEVKESIRDGRWRIP